MLIIYCTLKFQHIIFDCQSRKWKKHQRGGEKVISRMYTATPNDTEYYLHKIMLHIPDAKNFIRFT